MANCARVNGVCKRCEVAQTPIPSTSSPWRCRRASHVTVKDPALGCWIRQTRPCIRPSRLDAIASSSHRHLC